MKEGKTNYRIFHILNRKEVPERWKRKLIIDGNAVYEIDEDCMLKKRLDVNGEKDLKKYENKNGERKGTTKYKKGME